jgi:trans-aconitate methyltransferase
MQEYAAIKDLTAYTDRMSKGLIDKLFFVDKIDPGAVVDYGSADGLLLKQLGLWYPDASFVGFDTDGEMNCNAKKRCSEDAFYFTDEWSDVEVMVRRWKGEGRKVALNLSSIIHEVYHYMEPHEVDSFWVASLRDWLSTSSSFGT